MISSYHHAHFSPEEYLAIECISPIKHEYIAGQVVAMAGASKAHVIITGNLSSLLINHLRGTGCLAYATDMKVRLPEMNHFYYPDLAVTCDERDRRSDQDFILHPKLIIEVLSPTTEAFDRGDKFANYKTIPELEEYILIHQNQVLIEQFQRKSSNLWLPKIYRGKEVAEFMSIDCRMETSVLYQNVDQLV